MRICQPPTELEFVCATNANRERLLFEVIDDAVEFVLGKLNRPVGTCAKASQASGDFEVSRSVVAEAIKLQH